MQRRALRDYQQNSINGMLPGSMVSLDVTAVGNRPIVDAVLFVAASVFLGEICLDAKGTHAGHQCSSDKSCSADNDVG